MDLTFCTTCMGRTEFLRETLPINMERAPNCYFLVLDYNSPDDLLHYLRAFHAKDIDSGRLTVWSERTAKKFLPSHAKNVAKLLAKTELICNLDADNVVGDNFANESIAACKSICFCVPLQWQKGKTGRFVLRKSTFVRFGGYDESLENYGFEDIDLMLRMEAAHIPSVSVDDTNGYATQHSDALRVMYMDEKNASETNKAHSKMCRKRVGQGKFRVNIDSPWGCATVFKNFDSKQTVTVGKAAASHLI